MEGLATEAPKKTLTPDDIRAKTKQVLGKEAGISALCGEQGETSNDYTEILIQVQTVIQQVWGGA